MTRKEKHKQIENHAVQNGLLDRRSKRIKRAESKQRTQFLLAEQKELQRRNRNANADTSANSI